MKKITKISKKTCGTGEITMDYAKKTFDELLGFQGYGFCLGYDVPVTERTKGEIPLARIRVGDEVRAPAGWARVIAVIPQGIREVFDVALSNGKTLRCTIDHKVATGDGALASVLDAARDRLAVRCEDGSTGVIGEITFVGDLPVMDITVDTEDHLFFASGVVVSNCKAHATCYSVYSAVQMWLQERYFTEYMCALLTHIDRSKEKKGHSILQERVEYCIKHMSPDAIRYPTVNNYDSIDGKAVPSNRWRIESGAHLVAPLKNIKRFSDREVSAILACNSERPFDSLADFIERVKPNNNRFEAFLFSHSLDCLIPPDVSPDPITWAYNWYYLKYLKDAERTREAEKAGRHSTRIAEEEEDLFGELLGEEELSSDPGPDNWAENQTLFTREELDERCFDLNGFVIPDNIRLTYSKYFEQGIALVAEETGNEDYRKARSTKIRTLQDALTMEVEEDKYRRTWLLAKVTGEARGIPGKFGVFDKITINDGADTATITGRIPSELRKGVTAIFPASINDKNRIYVDDYALKNTDIVILPIPPRA